jgi:hypothetical protein
MKTVNTWFRESIERYKQLTEETSELKQNILTLPLEEIMRRCASIKKLQESFLDRDEKLQEIMAFIGSEILENPLLGKYQTALDEAIKETDQIAIKINYRKTLLMRELKRAENAKNQKASYPAGIESYTRTLQQSNLC